MSTGEDDMAMIDLWVLEDYEGQVWEFTCQVELPLVEMRGFLTLGESRGLDWTPEIVWEEGDMSQSPVSPLSTAWL